MKLMKFFSHEKCLDSFILNVLGFQVLRYVLGKLIFWFKYNFFPIDKNNIKKYLKNIKVIKNKTYKEIMKSSHVIFHESSAINFALLLNKKILSINSPLLGKWLNYRTKQIALKIKCPSYQLENICNLSNKSLLKILKKPYIKNYSYIRNNLIKIYNNKKVINYELENKKIFNKYLFNHD